MGVGNKHPQTQKSDYDYANYHGYLPTLPIVRHRQQKKWVAYPPYNNE